MYLLYAGPSNNKALFFESVLFGIDKSKTLLAVSNGYDLLCFLQQVKKGESYPSLIILEIDMPRLDGVETLELLKTDDIYCLIPVYILYTASSTKDISLCTKLGADCMPQPTTGGSWKTMVQHFCDSCNS
jgi:CheY-like chemotaxis protein